MQFISPGDLFQTNNYITWALRKRANPDDYTDAPGNYTLKPGTILEFVKVHGDTHIFWVTSHQLYVFWFGSTKYLFDAITPCKTLKSMSTK